MKTTDYRKLGKLGLFLGQWRPVDTVSLQSEENGWKEWVISREITPEPMSDVGKVRDLEAALG